MYEGKLTHEVNTQDNGDDHYHIHKYLGDCKLHVLGPERIVFFIFSHSLVFNWSCLYNRFLVSREIQVIDDDPTTG
jgi:hypothetical protein